MNKIIKYIIILMVFFLIYSLNVKAENNSIYVNLETLEYSTNEKEYNSLIEYKTLDSFLKDYNSNNLSSIYITDFLFDGVSAVKTPDLDDFVDKDSNDAKIKALDIKVININGINDYVFSGEINDAMIGVNTNHLVGNINIVLNNALINTNSKKAPAIYIYNKDKNYTDCKVTIKTLSGTKNYIEGGRLKKVSLIGSDELDQYINYYSGVNLENYSKYSSYYGIYTSDEIKNILFATVKAESDDLKEGDSYYFYKASGAISSDIDLYFEGSGYLKVISTKEGIESKGNLIFSGGSGEYEIVSQEDGLNTTTPSSNNEIVKNDLIIDVNTLLVSVSEDADEGDAIDSNGKLIINGGNIYAFAHPTSMDAGLDSTNGTYINGGTVIATGNMADKISNDSKQSFIFASFDKINSNTLIVVKNQNNEIITAFRTSRDIKNLVFSSKNLNYKTYSIYTGGTIDGEETNGLYTKINSYSGGKEINVDDNTSYQDKDISNTILIILFSEILLLIVFIIIYFRIKDKKNN